MARQYTFSKKEHLTSEKQIDALFSEGNRQFAYPLKMLFTQKNNSPQNHKILFGVPKKNIKKAVDRNILKRRLREAYRLHKSLLQTDSTLNIGFIYVEKTIVAYSVIEKAMKKLLLRIK